jgi:hypothetical protein
VSHFDAWWLPGFTPTHATAWWTLESRGTRARAPRLTSDDVAALAGRLRAHQRDYLARLPVDDVAQKLGAVINNWLDPYSPFLHQACKLIPAFSGYPEEAVRKGLAGYLGSFRTENLRRLLRDELGDPEVLDGFRPRRAAPGMTHATGPELTLHSFAGNTPGLPAQSLVAATLAKSASLGKVASQEPCFASLFVQSIARVDSRLAACFAITYWPHDDPAAKAASDQAFCEAELTVAYGSEAAIAAVRERLLPGARLIEYGHKLSFAVVCRERLTSDAVDDLAERAAYDVARFDQQGCLSPHVVYVERGGQVDALGLATAIGEALQRWSTIVPRGRLTDAERVSAAALRRHQEFRAAMGDGAVLAGDDWCVLFDPDPAFNASCLNRTVWVKPIDDAGDVPALLAPVRRYAQTVGLAASPSRMVELAGLFAKIGLDRVCPLGQMGDPTGTWHHDGRFNVLDFLRFTDLEPESTMGHWEFAHPEEGVLGRERPFGAQGGKRGD